MLARHELLVCNVSLRAPRAGITAEIAELATAVDATATGQVVFAVLVDDPSSVGDIVDAYLGELMVEAASADAVADAGLVYVAGIDEEATAIAAQDGAVPTIITSDITEAATATALTDATAISGADVTTTGVRGPLFMLDATFPSGSLTIIDVGR